MTAEASVGDTAGTSASGTADTSASGTVSSNTEPGKRRWHDGAWHWAAAPERVAIVVLAGLVLAAHDVGRLVNTSYWNDESWVAVTTRYPLSDLPRVTSSTPIGWSFLLRLIPAGGPERLRLLPLAFAALAVGAAIVFVRGLGWSGRWVALLAGATGGVVALFNPAMLGRNDLKQYTADAAVALIVLALTSRVERDPTRRNLIYLGSTLAVGMLFSHPTAFVGAAAIGALLAVALLRRAWRWAAEVAVVGAAAAVLMGAVYAIFDARAVVPGLVSYWRAYYLPRHHLLDVIHIVRLRVEASTVYLGYGPRWLLAVLVLAGLVTLLRLRKPATALLVVALPVEMVALGMLRKYPFLDLRTSTFLFVVFAVVAAVGAVGLVVEVARLVRQPMLVAAITLVAAGYVAQNAQYARAAPKTENIREQTQYVADHFRPDDVIVVNLSSLTGFGYYWPHGNRGIRHTTVVLQDYLPTFPDEPHIVTATNRDLTAVSAVVTAAVQQAAERPGARVWLIRTHVVGPELTAWPRALAADGMVATPIGPPGLSLMQP